MTSTQYSGRFAQLLFLLLLAFTLAGCGGSSGGTASVVTADSSPAAVSGACPNDCGTVMVGLTDADGDFLQYAVTVLSLSLTRADGVTVETLPQSAAVDFAQYTEMTEFLTAATVPNGAYVSAEITLDYAEARVTVERNGEAVNTQLFDTGGAELGIETLQLRLADDHPLVVLPGLPSIMVIDFDLAASHEVDLTTTPVNVTAAPFLVADIDPVDSKPMRLRGPMVSVNIDESLYVLAIRPFWRWNGDFGRARVHSSNDTAFEIDGVSYAGAEGLRAMTTLPPGTATLAFGVLDVTQRQFNAREVYAGSSVPGHDADIVRGVVTARIDDILTVRGATVVRRQGTAVFRGNVEVLVGPETTVRKAGDPIFDGNTTALSVGQRITAFGQISSDSTDQLLFDATAGRIRMLRTIVSGTTNDVLDGQINVDLQSIAGRNLRLFNFSGTGMPGEDADPDNYEIDIDVLDTSGLGVGSPVKVSGFVAAFGMAAPDFFAATIADFSQTRAQLFVGWNPSTATPFLTMGPEGLVIDLDNPDIGRRHHLVRGGVTTDLLTLPGASIGPRDDRPGLYGIQQGDSIHLHTDFSLFSRDLADQLSAGKTARSVYANGIWIGSTSEINASRILIRVN